MKQLLTRLCMLIMACTYLTHAANAQTLATTLGAGNSQSGITFNVKAYQAVTVTDVWVSFNTGFTGLTASVWYNPDSVNGAPTISTANGWVQAATNVPVTVTTGGVGTITLIPQVLAINIPAGATYGFYVETNNSGSGTMNYTNYAANTYFYTDNVIHINCGNGNVGYGGPSPNPTFSPRMFNGQIGYYSGPPCPLPTALTATNITSSTATVGWAAVPGSVGYELAVNQTAGNPAAFTGVNTTTQPLTGLTPSTAYWLHVRNKCSATSNSNWEHYQFATLPPCKPPVGFQTANLQASETDISWAAWPSATSYDYQVDQTRADPTSTTGLKNITAPADHIAGLTENTWYYVHVRTNCVGNELSDWGLDSFLTPIPCREPALKVDHLNTTEAVVYWDAVPTALQYEYAINTSATPPQVGTQYLATSLHVPSLNDGKEYYVHVRSHCNSLNVAGISPWATISFRTYPVNVAAVSGVGIMIQAFPNPVTDMLTIKSSLQEAATISVDDVSGKQVKAGVMNAGGEVQINMGDMPAGLYFIKYSSNALTETIKVVKR